MGANLVVRPLTRAPKGVLDARACALQAAVEVVGGKRVADPGGADRAKAHAPRTLELDGVVLGRGEATARDLQRPVRLLAKPGAADVDDADRLDQARWMLLLIETVRGSRRRHDGARRVGGLQYEVLVADLRDDRVGGRARRRAVRAALDDLRRVDRQRDVGAARDRQRRVDAHVARATGEDHLRTAGKRGVDRLIAHLRDDPRALPDGLIVELGRAAQRRELAGALRRGHYRGVLLGVDQRHARRNPRLGNELADDLVDPGEMWLATGATTGANDQRRIDLARSRQKVSQIALHRLAPGERGAGAKVVGARVGRAAIGADHMRALS